MTTEFKPDYSKPAGWFKMNLTVFHRETRGMSAASIGLWAQLQTLYWERDCTLPENPGKTLGIRKSLQPALDQILADWYPGGHHPYLKDAWETMRKRSEKKSADAAAQHRGRKQGSVAVLQPNSGQVVCTTSADSNDMFDQPEGSQSEQPCGSQADLCAAQDF